jgi:hypothetical protein
VLATVLVACAAAGGPSAEPAVAPVAAAPGNGGTAPATPAEVVIVLPPADGQAEAERARVRMLVERAAAEALPSGPAPVLLEPATSDAIDATVEAAVRRVGAAGTVCLIGADGAAVVAPVLALYPAARVCLLPASQDIATTGLVPPLTADVDLDRLGRELGAAARAAAGQGTVLVLAGRDGMLDRRWLVGVIAGAPGALHTVRSADAALANLEAPAADVLGGVVPDDDDLPLALPPVTVVVLDASSASAELVELLIERGLLVVGPRSLLVGVPDEAVVLRWRVRWDVPLTALLRRAGVGPGASEDPAGTEPLGTQPLWEDMVVLEPSRASVGP